LVHEFSHCFDVLEHFPKACSGQRPAIPTVLSEFAERELHLPPASADGWPKSAELHLRSRRVLACANSRSVSAGVNHCWSSLAVGMGLRARMRAPSIDGKIPPHKNGKESLKRDTKNQRPVAR
jgi:hypothetical protein